MLYAKPAQYLLYWRIETYYLLAKVKLGLCSIMMCFVIINLDKGFINYQRADIIFF